MANWVYASEKAQAFQAYLITLKSNEWFSTSRISYLITLKSKLLGQAEGTVPQGNCKLISRELTKNKSLLHIARKD
jgi:hypothetical protein